MNVRKNIELTLDSLNKKSQRNFLKTTLGFGYGYDSNTDSNSNDDFVNWGNIPLSIPDKKSDHVAEYILALNHTFKIKENLTMDNKFVGYMQKFNKDHDNDLSCKNRSKPDNDARVRPDAKTEFNRTVKRCSTGH